MENSSSVYQKLVHGLSFKKQKKEAQEEAVQAKVENYTVDKECFEANHEDMELFASALKFVNTHQILNSPDVLADRTDGETKAIHRRREALGKFLKQNNMKVHGDHVPLPILDFKDIVKNHKCPANLYKKLMGLKYISPTPIQSQSLPVMLDKRNCVCIAPTGSGKTVAYTLPLLANLVADKKKGRGLKGLIVAPTFELSLQIYTVALQLAGKADSADNIGLTVRHINKMNYKDEKEKYEADFEALDLLITTPLKFLNVAKLGVSLEKFDYVVLDEADKYFELGFLDQFKELTEVLRLTKKHYSLFSATFPSQIEKMVVDLLIDPVQIIIRGKMVVLDTISQKLTYCGSEHGKVVEIKNLIDRGELKIPCLIFVQSKDRAKQLYREVKSLGIPVGCIEAGMDRDRRRDIVNAFTVEKIFVLITTDLLARGLDFPKVRLVINYDMPSSSVNYIHRVGRTGRGGVRGQAITLYTKEDKPMLKVLGDLLHTSGVEVADWILNLPKPRKNVIKKLAKRPTEREHIDPTRKTEEFYDFRRQMKKKDQEYIQRIQDGEQGIIQKGEKDPRVLMASKIKEMMVDGGQQEQD